MKIKEILVSILLLITISLSACVGDSVLPRNESFYAIKPDNWQRIVEDSPYHLGEKQEAQRYFDDGSSYSYYTQDYGNFPCIDGSTALMPVAWEAVWQLLPDTYDFTGQHDSFATFFCNFSTTHQAYLNLIDKTPAIRTIYGGGGKATTTEFTKAPDIVLASSPSQEELDYAASKGVELVVNPVGYDSFVFITHKDNPVDSLTISQVQDIYSGKITNWKKVGGKNQKIKAYQRGKNSGSQTGMEQLVMKDIALMDAPTKLVADAMDGLVNKVADYKNNAGSIGYTYKYYLNNMCQGENVKIINIEGVEPNDQNIRNRAYPFVAKGNAVIRGDDNDRTGKLFMEWLMSEEGQRCVAQAGYVPAYL